MREKELRHEIVKACRKLVIYGLTFSSLGNVSVRYEDGLLITPSGVRFDELRPSEIVYVGLDGNILRGGKPSVETPMHIAVYKSINNASAIIHAHAPYATVLGTRMNKIVSGYEEAKAYGLNIIPVCEPAPSGTQKLAQNVVDALKKCKVIVIPNHGLVAYADNLSEALSLIEIAESIAKKKIIERLINFLR